MSDGPPAQRLGEALRRRGESIAVAESCTGGLLGSTITGVPGASDYFAGGIVAYMNRTKRQLLAITRESLERHGAVSEPVAREMAQHVRDEADTDWAVSTTGFAGHAAAESAEPAGTVYVGFATAGGPERDPATDVERYQFDGTRHGVKERIVDRALESAVARVEAD